LFQTAKTKTNWLATKAAATATTNSARGGFGGTTLPPIKKGETGFTEEVTTRSVPGCSGLAWGAFWGEFGFGLMQLRKNWVLRNLFLVSSFFPF
jgi:hypothetical protein